MGRYWTLIGLALVVVASPGQTDGGGEREAILERVRTAYAEIRTLRAEFVQENDWELLGEGAAYRGTLHVADDGRLRVEYQEPEGHLLVSDGGWLWTYVPESGQALKSNRTTEGRAVHRLFLDFLAGGRVLEVTVGETEAEIVLEPDPALMLSRIVVAVNRSTGLGRTFAWTDLEGNTARYELRTTEINLELDPDLFAFVPPDGVEVVELDEYRR